MKNISKRLFALTLCLIMVLGMFPVTVFAAEGSEAPLYMATEDGAVYAGTINTAQSEVETAATKTKLGKPKDLKWNKAIEWNCDGVQFLTTKYGSIAFTQNSPVEEDMAVYRIRLFRNGSLYYETYWGSGASDKYFSADLAEAVDFKSGTYYYTVQAIAQDTSKYSNSAVVTSAKWTYTKPSAKMAKPTNLKWNWPQCSWKGPDNHISYMVEWLYAPDKDSEPNWFHRQHGCVPSPHTPPDFVMQDLRAGYYYFRVRTLSDDITVKAHSNWSDLCGPYYFDDVDFIKAPTLKSSNVASSGKIKLTWNKVAGADKYQVYRSTKEGSGYKRIATTTKLTYTDTGAKAGTKYFYKVRAVSPSGNTLSKYSKVISRVCDLPRPEASVKLNSSNNPRISWAKIEGASKYQVYRATSKSGTYNLLGTTSNAYFVNKNAVAGKTYYYKVKAVHSNTNANSAFSAVVSIKDK